MRTTVRPHPRVARRAFALALALCALALAAGAEDRDAEAGPPAPTPIEIADVFRSLSTLADEIELVRVQLEGRLVEGPTFHVASPNLREIFHQAVALLARARRLSAEQLGEVGGPVTLVDREEQTAEDVLHVVDAALERVRRVREGHELAARGGAALPLPVEVDETTTYHAILTASRQLDALLDMQLTPADSEAQIAFALAHVDALVAASPAKAGTSAAPAAKARAATPARTHALLLDCFAIARRIGLATELDVLDAMPAPDDEAGAITDADVYDVATLLVSEVVRLYDRLANEDTPAPVLSELAPGDADAHASARRLHEQLASLERSARAAAADAPR